MNSRIKGFVLGILLMTAWFIPAVTIYAGNINAEEQRIIDVSEGEFTYNGKIYIATESIKTRLRNYLALDDVDLNKEDADRAIIKGFGSVSEGIERGYLILAPGQEDEPKKPGDNTADNSVVNPDTTPENAENISVGEIIGYKENEKEKQENYATEEGSEQEGPMSDQVEVIKQVADSGLIGSAPDEIVPGKVTNGGTSSVKDETFNDNINLPLIGCVAVGIIIVSGVAVVFIHRRRSSYGRNRKM